METLVNQIDVKVDAVIKELNGLILHDALTILKEVEKEITYLSTVSFGTYQQYLELRNNSK